MKKLICLTLGLIFLLTSANTFAETEQNEFTIAQLQEIAATNSSQVIIDDIDIREKQENLEAVVKNALSGGYSSNPVSILAYKVKSQVGPMEAENSLEIAKRNKVENIYNLKRSVFKTGFNILITQKQLESEKQKFTVLEEKYANAKVFYNAGLLDKESLIDLEYSVESRTNYISSIKDKLTGYDIDLKKALNKPLGGEPLKITDELIYSEIEDIDLDKAVEEALKKSLAIYKQELAFKIKEKTMELTEEFMTVLVNTFRLGGHIVFIGGFENYDKYINVYEPAVSQDGTIVAAEVRLDIADYSLAVNGKTCMHRMNLTQDL